MYLDEMEKIKLLKTSFSAEGTNPSDQSQSDQSRCDQFFESIASDQSRCDQFFESILRINRKR